MNKLPVNESWDYHDPAEGSLGSLKAWAIGGGVLLAIALGVTFVEKIRDNTEASRKDVAGVINDER